MIVVKHVSILYRTQSNTDYIKKIAFSEKILNQPIKSVVKLPVINFCGLFSGKNKKIYKII